MANEWRRVSFAQLIEGGVLEIGDGYRAKNSELGGDGPIFLRAGHVRDTHIDLEGVDRFHRELSAAVASKTSAPGDVIVTTKGNSTGRVAFIDERMPRVVYSPHLSYWRSKDRSVLVPGFLRYWSRSLEFRRQLSGLASSTDMAPYLSLADQKRLRITLPPPAEQERIARVLGALDDKIELNRRMSQTLESMARALFRSWFVDFDPVRARAKGLDTGLPQRLAQLFPDSFIDSEVGKIPAGWQVTTLASFADLNPESWTAGTRPKSIDYVDLANAKFGRIEKTVRYKAPDAPSRAQRVLRPGDTIVGTVRPGNRSYALVAADGLTGSTGFAVLRPRRSEFRDYVFLRATGDDAIDELARLADGAAYPAVRPEVVSRTPAVAPSQGIVLAFAAATAPLLDRYSAADSETRTLVSVRNELLAPLLAGGPSASPTPSTAGGARS